MSTFRVTPAAIAEAAGRLGAISSGVDGLHGRLGAHSGAAAGTPLDGALDGLIGHWAQVLPVFALAGERLTGAVGGAAAAYTVSDAAVGGACAMGGAGGHGGSAGGDGR